MQIVPLSPVPDQTLQIVLGGQNCVISIYTLNGYSMVADNNLDVPQSFLYFDLAVNGAQITNTVICLDRDRLLLSRAYLGVVGDFMFVDTQGSSDPQASGLGSRYQLLYLEASDLG